MRRSIMLVTLLPASTVLRAQVFASARPHDGPVAITHVAVIDPATGATLQDRTVLVRGRHIARMDTASRVRVPNGTRVVDGRGRYLIPGLWDMHAHFLGDRRTRTNLFPLFIANGITGARNMWGDCDSICSVGDADNDRPVSAAIVQSWEHDITSGALVGPRLVNASAIFDGPTPEFPGSYAIDSPAEGREKVRLARRRGADFIKVLPWLSRESYLAIVDEAKREGLTVAGHVPFAMTPLEVSNAGQRSIEHARDPVAFGTYSQNAACSSQPADVRAALTAARTRRDTSAAAQDRLRVAYLRILTSSYSEALCGDLFAHFARNGTRRVLTLGAEVNDERVRLGDTLLTTDPRLRYVDSQMRTSWRQSMGSRRMGEDSAATVELLRLMLSLPGAMHRAGVSLLAGTDEPVAWVIPGFSLHDELALYVQGGLTPLQALQTATINPARFLNVTDSLGAVVRGKLADLVLLDADPLIDIRNTTRIAGVLSNGRYFDRPALQELLEEAARAASATSDENTETLHPAHAEALMAPVRSSVSRTLCLFGL